METQYEPEYCIRIAEQQMDNYNSTKNPIHLVLTEYSLITARKNGGNTDDSVKRLESLLRKEK